MSKQITKTVKFNGKTIIYTEVNSVDYIALKPVCEALEVDYIQQYKNTREDIFLRPALCKHTMQVPEDQNREYVCLPEEYIYGWICSIQSQSPALQEYKRECYHILFLHFHGTITQRRALIKEKAIVSKKRKELEALLADNKDFVELFELKAKEARIVKDLRKQDDIEIENQLTLFS